MKAAMKQSTLFDIAPTTKAIEDSYSADTIIQGRVRDPIEINGQPYVVVGMVCQGPHVLSYDAAELIPANEFKGKTATYSERTKDDGAKARNDPRGFYYGVKVQRQGKDYVLGNEIKREETKP